MSKKKDKEELQESSNPFNKEMDLDEVENHQEEQEQEDAKETNDSANDNDGYKEKYDQLNNQYVRLAADFDNFRKDLKEKDKEYQKLEKQREEEGILNGELAYALGIYREYGDKLADMHKSSKPLEVHVVCGRGKKSMTAGADDQLEEQDNDSNQ